MVPIAIVSAFLNNTPVVAVMIPIVQRWGKNIGVSAQQLLIPLSFASILGGTCTLIGTSTNLVVKGLLDERYANDDSVSISLFSIGEYGVPIALAGMTYIILASPVLLPGAQGRQSDVVNPLEDDEDILLGARLTQWSPAAGRSVKRSGLRDTGGIYLVSVHRYATGNVHRAVGQDFVLNVGDILYFTGLVEGFGDFCEEHGLEMITNEVEASVHGPKAHSMGAQKDAKNGEALPVREAPTEELEDEALFPQSTGNGAPLATLYEQEDLGDIPCEVGVTKESLVQADGAERLRNINRLVDMIRGTARDESDDIGSVTPSRRRRQLSSQPVFSDPPKVVVTVDKDLVVVGVDSRDRPGLLLDLSKGILSLNLQLHHTEAAVVDNRSLSIWRCEPIGTEIPDVEQVWSVLTVSHVMSSCPLSRCHSLFCSASLPGAP
jgi:hypothetical protein